MIRKILDLAGIVAVLVCAFLFRRTKARIETAQAEAKKSKADGELAALKARSEATTQEIELAETERKDAEAKLRTALNEPTTPPGSDCGKR